MHHDFYGPLRPLHCNTCDTTKVVEDFHRSLGRPNRFNRTSHCRSCQQARDLAYRLANPVRVSANGLLWRRQNPKSQLVLTARGRAKAQALPFNLTAADFDIPKVCPVLGIPMVSKRDGTSGPQESSPSLDKLVPALGYVKGNVRVISYRANRLKSDATLEELQALVRYMQEHLAA